MEEEKDPVNQENTSGVETKESVVLEEDVESLKKALEEKKAEAEKYLSNWQRAEADLANYKKRTEQERNEAVRFANAMLILNLLPVLDDFERAFQSLPSKLAGLTWVDGIGLIHRKFQAALEAQGVSSIKALGESFDPTIHEAVMHGEGEEGKVVEEFQKGYKLQDRVIRPALVMVGKGKGEEKPSESKD